MRRMVSQKKLKSDDVDAEIQNRNTKRVKQRALSHFFINIKDYGIFRPFIFLLSTMGFFKRND